MSDKRDESGRVAELEAEVARLRERLGEGEPPDGQGAPGATDPDGAERPLGHVSRGKVVGVAVAVVVIALVAFAAIFTALRSGFDSLAKKAAQSLVPEAPGGPAGGAGSGSGSGSAPPPGPSAPGL